MSCDQYSDAIAEFVDGTLAGAALTAVQAHLDGCEACRALAADLRQIRQVARTLEPLPPPPGVWARLASRIGEPPARRVGAASLWFLQPRWLAIAATLVVAAGVTTALLLRSAPGPAPASTPAAPTTTVAGNAPVDDIVQHVEGELKQAEQHYQAALTDLDRIAANGGPLDPKVTAALRQNVALVDKAIADSRAALKEDPQSVPARESLFDALRRKVVLLQDTIGLVSEMSRGNQAGAAAIAEGLKKS